MKQKNILSGISISVLYLAVFLLMYCLLQNSFIYNRFFSAFMPTYENVDGVISKGNKPFTEISDQTLNTMDAAHYVTIRDHLYTATPEIEDSQFNAAFFPLFPLVWKLFFLPARGVIFLNFLLYVISAMILAFIFCKNSFINALLVTFTLPTLTVFLVPYSEAVFMLSISITLLGWKQKNKYIYMGGLLAASMTRPVFLLMIAAIIATEAFYFARDKAYKINYKHVLISVLTLLSGTFIVALFQQLYHHGSLLTFIEAQKHWGTYFRIPSKIIDGSFESLGMNIFALVFCFFFGAAVLVPKFLPKAQKETDPFDYWYYFSWIYLLIATLFVLLLQGGSLHSLYRYTLCTPFFYIIVFQQFRSGFKLSQLELIWIFGGFIFCCLLFMELAPYSRSWDLEEAKGYGFTKMGFLLLCLCLFYFLILKNCNHFFKYIFLGLLIFSGIIWNCYLLNMFTSHTWIFL
ncbi:MAG: hypothetical protein JWP12_2063 [Bacteroidetes bacterium]|nr:hypothetical protein [Bacteroidota bacterium]